MVVKMQPVHKVVIIGLGLIGGSLGLAWKRVGAVEEVIGVDNNIEACRRAEQLGAVHLATTDISKAVKDAQVIILAVPVEKMIGLAKVIVRNMPENCIVSDVGSTKSGVVKSLNEIFAKKGVYIGGHPMAGSEVAGIEGADPYLFENAAYILTPDQEETLAFETISYLIENLGAKKMVMSPLEHDKIVAAVSHLPHVVAAALVNTVGDVEKEWARTLMLAAGGFRDTTRIASGSPDLWQGICITNKEHLISVIDLLQNNLALFKNSLLNDGLHKIEDFFVKARDTRENIPAKRRGFLPQVFDLVVIVPDEPGVIGSLAQLLGQQNINIADIEILRVREGEGGTIRLGVQSYEAMDKAVVLLEKEGYSVRKL